MGSIVRIGSAKAAVIASVYAVLTVVLQPISFGPFQVRIINTLLPIPYHPYFGFYGVVGLTIGCLLANLVSPFGIIDVIMGTITNFIAGTASWLVGRALYGRLVGRIPAIVLDIAIVTFMIGYVLLHVLIKIPWIESVIGAFIGEFISVGMGGYIVLTLLEKRLGP